MNIFYFITPNLTTCFRCHLEEVQLYGPLYLALSGVTCPLRRHLMPFTNNGNLLPVMGPFCPHGPPVREFWGGLHQL